MRFVEGFNEVKVVVFLFLLFFGVKKSWNGGIFDRSGGRIVKDIVLFLFVVSVDGVGAATVILG